MQKIYRRLRARTRFPIPVIFFIYLPKYFAVLPTHRFPSNGPPQVALDWEWFTGSKADSASLLLLLPLWMHRDDLKALHSNLIFRCRKRGPLPHSLFSGNCCFRKIFPKTSRTANSCRAFGKFNKFYNNTAPIFKQTIWRNLGAFNCLRENAVRRRRKFWPAGWPLEYGQGDKSTPLMMCIGSLSLRAGGQQPPKKRVINLHQTVTMWWKSVANIHTHSEFNSLFRIGYFCIVIWMYVQTTRKRFELV